MQPTILLPSTIRKQILYECMQKRPNEACGFIWGTLYSDVIQVKAFTPVANCAPDPSTQFFMDPASLVSLLLGRVQNSLQAAGILHSHPTAAAIPSQEDLMTCWHTLPSHWIVSLQQATPHIAAYQYTRQDPFNQSDGSVFHYRPLAITVIPN